MFGRGKLFLMPEKMPKNKDKKTFKLFLCRWYSIKAVVGLILTFSLFFVVRSCCGLVYAVSYGTATTIPIEASDIEVEAGHIISFKNGKYTLTSKALDAFMFGVVVDAPALAIEDVDLSEDPHARLVMSAGEATVKVKSTEGIKEGDFITSSETPGVGQRAETNGVVLGIALEDLSVEEGGEEGVVDLLVALDIKPSIVSSDVRVNLVEMLRGGLSAPFLTPITSLRYILAVLIVCVSFLLGFSSFSKSSSGSIEALGRNPLASKEIKIAVVFNFILTFGIMLIGLGLAYLVLIL